MVMTDIFDKLKSLQNILVRKYELEKQIQETPKQLDSQEELLARMRKEFIEKNDEFNAVKEKVGTLKVNLEVAVKTREDGEKNMDNITTHREYEALEKQISEATDKESEIRKELQREEKTLEQLKEELNATESMINSQDEELKNSKDKLNDELNSYNDELTQLSNQEAEITPGLEPEILFKFQRIIQRNSEGIVAVKNGVCTGCHMILPGQFANEVREGENILFCPYCSRILYYEESDEESDDTFFSLDDAGSLADFEDDEEYDEDMYDAEDKDLAEASEDEDSEEESEE